MAASLHCTMHTSPPDTTTSSTSAGHYVKDLSLLNREIQQTIIVDNSPMSYIFHPENAIDCSSFFDDPADVELWQVSSCLLLPEMCLCCSNMSPLLIITDCGLFSEY